MHPVLQIRGEIHEIDDSQKASVSQKCLHECCFEVDVKICYRHQKYSIFVIKRSDEPLDRIKEPHPYLGSLMYTNQGLTAQEILLILDEHLTYVNLETLTASLWTSEGKELLQYQLDDENIWSSINLIRILWKNFEI